MFISASNVTDEQSEKKNVASFTHSLCSFTLKLALCLTC